MRVLGRSLINGNKGSFECVLHRQWGKVANGVILYDPVVGGGKVQQSQRFFFSPFLTVHLLWPPPPMNQSRDAWLIYRLCYTLSICHLSMHY